MQAPRPNEMIEARHDRLDPLKAWFINTGMVVKFGGWERLRILFTGRLYMEVRTKVEPMAGGGVKTTTVVGN